MAANKPAVTGTANQQTTTLTPNSNCVAVGSGDSNNTTQVQFFAPPNGIAWWTTSVGTANTSAQLGADQGNAVVTFQKGLTVTYRPLGNGGYNVTMAGTITDGSSVYPYNGQVIYQSTGTSSPAVIAKPAKA